jgi:hypothetical protein
MQILHNTGPCDFVRADFVSRIRRESQSGDAVSAVERLHDRSQKEIAPNMQLEKF